MDGLRKTIGQFDERDAASLEAYWRREIEAGRHVILEWEGMHAKG
jgi:hypothetical protein